MNTGFIIVFCILMFTLEALIFGQQFILLSGSSLSYQMSIIPTFQAGIPVLDIIVFGAQMLGWFVVTLFSFISMIAMLMGTPILIAQTYTILIPVNAFLYIFFGYALVKAIEPFIETLISAMADAIPL